MHRWCPQCKTREGTFVTGDIDKDIPYNIYVCPNPKCLEIWRIPLNGDGVSE